MKAKVFLTLSVACFLLSLGLLAGLAISNAVWAEDTKLPTSHSNPWGLAYQDQDWNHWGNPPHMYTIPSGNIGIGTAAPGDLLEIAGCNGSGITLTGTESQESPTLTVDNVNNANASVLAARDSFAFTFEYPEDTALLSVDTSGRVDVSDDFYQYGNRRYQNGVFEYVYSETGALDGNGDATVQVPGTLFVAGDNIIFTYEAWVSIDYDSSWPHTGRGAGYLKGQAWKERGVGVSGYSTEHSYYKGSAISITASTYNTNNTQFVIDAGFTTQNYKFTVRATSGGH